MPVGTNSIEASYAGDTMWTGSVSRTFNQRVNTATTTTTVTSSQNPATVGQPVSFTAKLQSSGGVPTGSVTFKGNGTTLGTVNLSGGEAKLTTSTLRAGTINVSAQYNAATGFSGSSATLNQVVNDSGTTTTITSASPNPATYGQAVTFVAKVTGDSPTGTVRFYSGSTYLGKGTLSGSAASFTTSGKQLPQGADSITATYGGDSNNNESTSKPITETVN